MGFVAVVRYSEPIVGLLMAYGGVARCIRWFWAVYYPVFLVFRVSSSIYRKNIPVLKSILQQYLLVDRTKNKTID